MYTLERTSYAFFMKICQNVYLYKILTKFETGLGPVKARSPEIVSEYDQEIPQSDRRMTPKPYPTRYSAPPPEPTIKTRPSNNSPESTNQKTQTHRPRHAPPQKGPNPKLHQKKTTQSVLGRTQKTLFEPYDTHNPAPAIQQSKQASQPKPTTPEHPPAI